MGIAKTAETVTLVDEGNETNGRKADVHRDDVTGQEYYCIEHYPEEGRRWQADNNAWKRFGDRLVRFGNVTITPRPGRTSCW